MANIIIEGEEFAPEEFDFQSTATGNIVIEGEEFTPEELGLESAQAQPQQPQQPQPPEQQFTPPTVESGQVTFQNQTPTKSTEIEVQPNVLTTLDQTGSLMPVAEQTQSPLSAQPDPGLTDEQMRTGTFDFEGNLVEGLEGVDDRTIEEKNFDSLKERSAVVMRGDPEEIAAFNLHEKRNKFFGFDSDPIRPDEISKESAVKVFGERLGKTVETLGKDFIDNFADSTDRSVEGWKTILTQNPIKTVGDALVGLKDLSLALATKTMQSTGLDVELQSEEKAIVREEMVQNIQDKIQLIYDTHGEEGVRMLARNPVQVLESTAGGMLVKPTLKVAKLTAETAGRATKANQLINAISDKASDAIAAGAHKKQLQHFERISEEAGRKNRTLGRWIIATGGDTSSILKMYEHSKDMQKRAIAAVDNRLEDFSRTNPKIKSPIAEEELSIIVKELKDEAKFLKSKGVTDLDDEVKAIEKIQQLLGKNKAFSLKKISGIKKNISKERSSGLDKIKAIDNKEKSFESKMNSDVKDINKNINIIERKRQLKVDNYNKSRSSLETRMDKAKTDAGKDLIREKMDALDSRHSIELDEMDLRVDKLNKNISSKQADFQTKQDKLNVEREDIQSQFKQATSGLDSDLLVESLAGATEGITVTELNGIQRIFTAITDAYNVSGDVKHSAFKKKSAEIRNRMKRFLEDTVREEIPDLDKMNNDIRLAHQAEKALSGAKVERGLFSGMDVMLGSLLTMSSGVAPAVGAVALKNTLRSPRANATFARWTKKLTPQGRKDLEDAFAKGRVTPKAKVQLGKLIKEFGKMGVALKVRNDLVEQVEQLSRDIINRRSKVSTETGQDLSIGNIGSSSFNVR